MGKAAITSSTCGQGTYSVSFLLPGFSTIIREGIELTAGFTATINVELGIGGIEETITVSGASPVVDVQNVRQQTVFSDELLDMLPSSGKSLVGLHQVDPRVAGRGRCRRRRGSLGDGQRHNRHRARQGWRQILL